MSYLTCRKTMMNCQTPGMCAPYGGCQPHAVTESVFKADYAALEAERERLRDMLREASVAMGEAHDSLFVQCFSNGITNAWGKPVNVSKINDLQLTANRIDAALSAKPCSHEWADARNSRVLSGELCVKCNAIRAGNQPVSTKP